MKKVGGDQGYSGNDNRTFCKDNNIETSFTQKGKSGTNEVKNATKRELARVRATAMEGSFGTQKEHYGLRKIAARIKSTEIMLIFFGIHTANVVNLARRESIQNDHPYIRGGNKYLNCMEKGGKLFSFLYL